MKWLRVRVEPWFRDGFIYAVLLISAIITFASLATAYARAFLPGA